MSVFIQFFVGTKGNRLSNRYVQLIVDISNSSRVSLFQGKLYDIPVHLTHSDQNILEVLPLGMAHANLQCQECGCFCDSCHSNNSLHLHKEIEELKKEVHQREAHIVQMETNVLASADRYPNGEYAALREEMFLLQEKYERLMENHRKLQRVNQGLEDKLLKIVDKYETEKSALNRDIANLTTRLVEARVSSAQLEEENEQYRDDCNIAIQLLQCKPSHFMAHKLETFPVDLQQKAKVHLSFRKGGEKIGNSQTNHSNELRTIRVPIPTFPPTAMVYSVSNGEANHSNGHSSGNANGNTSTGTVGRSASSNDIVSAAIMAKVLEERAKERSSNGTGCCSSSGQKLAGSHCMSHCRCRRSSAIGSDCHVFEDAACQTQWTIPVDAYYNGWNFELPPSYSQPCLCGMQVSSSSICSTAGVHTQQRLDSRVACAAPVDLGSRHKWKRSGSSSTSTETEI